MQSPGKPGLFCFYASYGKNLPVDAYYVQKMKLSGIVDLLCSCKGVITTKKYGCDILVITTKYYCLLQKKSSPNEKSFIKSHRHINPIYRFA